MKEQPRRDVEFRSVSRIHLQHLRRDRFIAILLPSMVQNRALVSSEENAVGKRRVGRNRCVKPMASLRSVHSAELLAISLAAMPEILFDRRRRTEFRQLREANNSELEEANRGGHWRLKNRPVQRSAGLLEATRCQREEKKTGSPNSSKNWRSGSRRQVRHRTIHDGKQQTACESLVCDRVRADRCWICARRRVFLAKKGDLAKSRFQHGSSFHEHEGSTAGIDITQNRGQEYRLSGGDGLQEFMQSSRGRSRGGQQLTIRRLADFVRAVCRTSPSDGSVGLFYQLVACIAGEPLTVYMAVGRRVCSRIVVSALRADNAPRVASVTHRFETE